MLTYNQEAYIAQAIEGVIQQVTNFPYQLVIGEDCSTDATRKICETYASKHPDKIKVLPALAKNIGLIQNYLRTIKSCDGDYIAICDGDDYWTDTQKLQKQVDYVRNNPECKIVYTNHTRLYADGRTQTDATFFKSPKSTFEDLIQNNFIPSVTVLFKNDQNSKSLPDWILKYPYGDWPTYLWTLRDGGTIGYINEDTATYRMDIGTSAGLIKNTSTLLKVNLNILLDMHQDASFVSQKPSIENSIKRQHLALMTSYNRERKFLSASRYLLKNVVNSDKKLLTLKLYAYSLFKKIKNQ